MIHKKFTISLLIGLTAAAALLRAEPGPATAPATQPAAVRTASGLSIETLHAGDAAADLGDRVWLHYEGRLADGDVFESSYKEGEPVDVRLGDERLIAGWTEGIKGMRVGEKRRLVIPPELGYGDKKYGPIPGKSTLTFDIELVGLLKK